MGNEIHRGGGKRRRRLARGAADQWGNATSEQLRSVGFSPREIEGMAKRGELLREHQGVYAVGHRSPAPEARWAAALLAAGPAAALSHTGAASARGLIAVRNVIEVTSPTKRRGDERLQVHWSPLPDREVTLHKADRPRPRRRLLRATEPRR